MSIFEILNETNHNLIKGVNANLESCANLRSVYDVRFINSLVKKKSYRNYLLWILASNKEYARALRREIDDHIGLTKGEDNFEGIDKTLKSLTDKRIEHTLTTLDLTAMYRKGGFSVRYEPTLENTQFRPDFEIHNEHRVFFEVKSMFGHREIQKFDKVDMQIQAGLKKIPTSFIYSLTYKRGFEKIDVSAFLSFARRSLGEIENLEEFPAVIYYPDEEHALVKMLLHKRVSDKEGYLAAVSTPIFTVHSARRVRDSLSQFCLASDFSSSFFLRCISHEGTLGFRILTRTVCLLAS